MARLDYKTYWNSKGEYGQIRVKRMLARKQKRKEKKGSSFDCPKCGRFVGYYVGYVINPYYADMYGQEYKERMCGDCYQSALGDI